MRSDKPGLSEQGPEPAAADRAGPPPDDLLATSLRGFGPLGILAVLVILAGNLIVVPLSAVLVLGWTHLSRTPWYEIGYVRPKSWAASLAVGLVFGSTFEENMFDSANPKRPLPNRPLRYLTRSFYVSNPLELDALPGLAIGLILKDRG